MDNDLISRKAVLKVINDWWKIAISAESKPTIIDDIKGLPSIQPKPKTGHWILIDKELSRYKCSECGEVIRLYKKSEIPKLEKDETLSDYPFSHCGCRMVEPQESEDEE